MVNKMIVSELLFFALNKFGIVPVDQLKRIINDFYSVGDIRAAKELFRGELVKIVAPDMADATPAELAKHTVGELPRLVTHSRGDNRATLEAHDLFELIVKADEMKMLVQLPTFVAATYDRIPVVKAEDLDLCLLAKRLARLETTVAGHTRTLLETADKALDEWPSLGDLNDKSWAAVMGNTSPSAAGDHVLPVAGSAQMKYAVVTGNTVKQADTSSVTVRRPVSLHQPQQHRVLRGKCGDTTDSGPKGVPRRLHAFVSRLSAETTAEDLAGWLGKAGIEAKCTQVVPKDGRKFKTNAFHVSCDARCAKLFYDEATWPEGCELRDWVFYAPRNVQNATNVNNS